MNVTYCIFLLTFLGYPIIALVLSKFIDLSKASNLLKPVILFFLIHNGLFAIGYSLSGDYIDYFIFSIEYFALCVTIIALCKATNIYIKIFRILGTIAISAGVIIGLIGVLLFIAISSEYEADKIFHFNNSNKMYETRRYSFGFATLESIRYTFETYRTYKYFPLERRIDTTSFPDNGTEMQIGNDKLTVSIVNAGNKEQILFKSTNGHIFLKSLDY